MNLFNKQFLLIPASFVILVFSFYMSYKNISLNTNMIKYLQKDQIKLSYLSNKLNQDIKINQISIQHSLLFNRPIDKETILGSITTINSILKRLDNFSQKKSTLKNMHDFNQIVLSLKEKHLAYKNTITSILDTVNISKDKNRQKIIYNFDKTTVAFSKDIDRLIDITNTDLYTNILNLKIKNDQSSQITILSFFIALLLISISLYKILAQSKEIKKELTRAESAEKMQKKLQEQILEYNEDLEEDISRKTKELQVKMYTHFLSGLPNRHKLLEDSDIYNFSQIALLNIDKFQKFNDVYGEEMGNIAIQLSAKFLLSEIKDEDIMLYHIGGDEFVYTRKSSQDSDNNLFVEKIEYILSRYSKEVFNYGDDKFNFVMSAGIAFTGKKKMLAYADMSLKDAKKRNIPFSIYSDTTSLEKTHQDDIECHKKLLHALKTDAVISHFQPIVPIQDSNKQIRYESLVRIKAVDGSIIPPFNFIKVAVSNRIYYKITSQVLKNTLAVIEEHKIPCSLNISMLDIENKRTLKMLYEAFTHFKYNNYLTIELLETEEFQDYKAVYDFCIKIRSFGIKIALDDFGSGYSSFAHIMNLPIDFIKIDASLISNIDRDPKAQIMVETIVSLAHKLNIETIAEFVSSQEILNVTKKLKIDYAQGFYTGKPADISSHIWITNL